MNVSMMDSYNLAWKLAHEVHGLSPRNSGPSVLSTYGEERSEIAKMLIEFDTKFSSMFSGKIGPDSSVDELTHGQFLKVFSDGSGFTSGCGIEYSPSILVQAPAVDGDYPVTRDDYLQGVLKPGRRLLDSIVRRYADANLRHLQDGRARLRLGLANAKRCQISSPLAASGYSYSQLSILSRKMACLPRRLIVSV